MWVVDHYCQPKLSRKYQEKLEEFSFIWKDKFLFLDQLFDYTIEWIWTWKWTFQKWKITFRFFIWNIYTVVIAWLSNKHQKTEFIISFYFVIINIATPPARNRLTHTLNTFKFGWIVTDVGYLRLGFEYFSEGFAPTLVPTQLALASSRSWRALSIPLVTFFWEPSHPWEKG